mmetsp:Transcript_18442/g.41585  ORF Transcript_18442/g.41585 Transcript_18442/m.41585 type:complete len:85 (+) Transcript_18442:380-634(+)
MGNCCTPTIPTGGGGGGGRSSVDPLVGVSAEVVVAAGVAAPAKVAAKVAAGSAVGVAGVVAGAVSWACGCVELSAFLAAAASKA